MVVRFQTAIVLSLVLSWLASVFPADASQSAEDAARLVVRSEPQAAHVYVDGEYRGMTPVEVEIDPGDHAIRIVKDGYLLVEQAVTIDPESRSELSVTLEAAAILRIVTAPGGADVLVDGVKEAESPAEVPVRPGLRAIEVVKTGHESWSGKLSFTAGERRLVNLELPYRFGRLEIFSSPSGSRVYLDDEAQDSVTPLVLEEVVPGRYHLRLVLDTFEDSVSEVTVGRGETVSVFEKLKHTLAYLEKERHRREARNAKIRTGVRIASLGVGVVSAAYAFSLHRGLKDREDLYSRTAFADRALKYRQEVLDWEERRNLWGGVAALTLSVGFLTFVF